MAEHLSAVLNTIVDEESRVMKDHSDWKLNPGEMGSTGSGSVLHPD